MPITKEKLEERLKLLQQDKSTLEAQMDKTAHELSSCLGHLQECQFWLEFTAVPPVPVQE